MTRFWCSNLASPDRTPHLHDTGIEVNIFPSESTEFSHSHPCLGSQPEESLIRLVRSVDDLLHLIRREHAPVLRSCPGKLDVFRINVDVHISPGPCTIPHHLEYVPDVPGGFGTVILCQVADELLHHPDINLPHLDIVQIRPDMVLHHALGRVLG